jgi:signal transduction histidine kinase
MEEGVSGGIGAVDLGPPFGVLRFFVRPVSDAGPMVSAVVSGIGTSDLVLQPQRLLLVMLLMAPLVIIASTFIAYALAGRTLQPVTSIVDEVEAITDGRSLHRRLAQPLSRDEVSRLVRTLNEMLSRLETSFAALRRFTADASHELKTPLTVLRSGIERAMTHPEVRPQVLGVLEETLVEQKRMTELVDSLLTLARADEGRAPLVLERADLADILNEISETASLLGEQAGVDVTVSMPRRPQVLSVDRGRIRQLLMNLLTNAIKYTPAGGTVSVEPVKKRDEILIKVVDTGVGISPGELPHVFDRFWRSDPARSRSSQRGGTGLGLAICKWIAEAHGGSIRVQSRQGIGTTMTVALPLDG